MDKARGDPPIVRRRPLLIGTMVGLAAAGTTRAQGDAASDWPNRPVVYINVFTPGGTTDTM
jgi:tripartite-type tricarboxylate transporter receptor subunit TctC